MIRFRFKLNHVRFKLIHFQIKLIHFQSRETRGPKPSFSSCSWSSSSASTYSWGSVSDCGSRSFLLLGFLHNLTLRNTQNHWFAFSFRSTSFKRDTQVADQRCGPIGKGSGGRMMHVWYHPVSKADRNQNAPTPHVWQLGDVLNSKPQISEPRASDGLGGMREA